VPFAARVQSARSAMGANCSNSCASCSSTCSCRGYTTNAEDVVASRPEGVKSVALPKDVCAEAAAGMRNEAPRNPTLLTGSRVASNDVRGEAAVTVSAASVKKSKVSGFRPRLFKVHRRPEGVTMSEEVPIARSSLTGCDSFILDAGSAVYLWSGPNASSLKRAVANEVAKGIEKEHAGQATLSIPRGPDDKFWQMLDNPRTTDTTPPPRSVASEDRIAEDEEDYASI